MGFLNKLIGMQELKLPETKSKEAQVLTYVSFVLMENGDVHVKTDWISQNEGMAHIYANLLYQINTGNMYDSTIETLTNYALNNVKSQEFIVSILEEFKKLVDINDKIPLIPPSRALYVNTINKKEE